MKDFGYTIQNEYASFSKLITVIDTFAQAVSLDNFTDAFIKEIWDITSCNGWALDRWGRVVGVSRYVKPVISEDLIFGFYEAKDTNPAITNYPTPFNTGPFWQGRGSSKNIVMLSDYAYRAFILAKAFSNLSIAIIPQINRFLRILFKDRPDTYCEDSRNFNLIIHTKYITAWELALIYNYNVDPGREVLSAQGDAIRNMTGSFQCDVNGNIANARATGAFIASTPSRSGDSGENANEVHTISFDASRIVPTAAENRPKNIAFLYIVRAA